jgi:putative hemolysin
MEFLIVLVLLLLNGILAGSEIAVLSARRARLSEQAEAGDKAAGAALKLTEDPENFLSTVQIGITLVGIMLGAFGGASIAEQVAPLLEPALGEQAQSVSLVLVVLTTTYLSLVIGELVPKRLALLYPEGISRAVARPMVWLARATTPFVWILGRSTSLVVRLLGIKDTERSQMTNAEVVTMIREGIDQGAFGEAEDAMVAGVLGLDEMRISKIITPRTETIWLDINASIEDIQRLVREKPFSAYPVARGSLDEVVGIVRAKDILASTLDTGSFDLENIMREPHYIPETATVYNALEQFKRSGIHTALIISEYGGIEGMVRMHDIIELIFGELDVLGGDGHDPEAVQREDGSWLLGGGVSVDELGALFPDVSFTQPPHANYETLAGFIMVQLDRVPQVSDRFSYGGLLFEVVDMDEVRVDKVLVRPQNND